MKNKKIIVIPIIVVIAIILIVGGVFAYLYFATDTFKSNKEMFVKYFSENQEIANIFNIDELKNISNRQKTEKYTTSGSIKTTVDYTDTQDQELSNAIQNTSITFLGNVDNQNKYFYQNIYANYSDTQSLNAEIVRKKDVYAIKINEVLNKFIGIENNNLKVFATKMGLDEENLQNIPDRIDFEGILSGVTTDVFTEAEKETLKNRYFSIITENITDDMFSRESTENEKVYVLKIKQSKAKEILTKIINTLKTDEILLSKIRNLLVNKANISEEDANNYIEEFIEMLSSSIDEQDLYQNDFLVENIDTNNLAQPTPSTQESTEKELSVKVYVQNKKLIKTTFGTESYVTISPIENGVIIENVTINDEDGYKITIQKQTNPGQVGYSLIIMNGNSQIGNLIYNVSGLDGNAITEKSEISMTSEYEKATSTYTCTKTFGPTEVLAEVANEDIMLVNTAPNAEAVSSLFEQVSNKIMEVNKAKMTAAGLNPDGENPFTQYIQAIIPLGTSIIFNSPENAPVVMPIGILGVASSIILYEEDNSILERAGQAREINR